METNYMNKNGCSSIILGLMSFCAILISFFTLNEMKTQRELAIQPDLYIEELENVQLKTDTLCNKCIYSTKIYDPKSNNPLRNFFKLKLINVGSGNAVNIKIKIDTDIEFFESMMDTLIIDSTIFNIKVGKEYFLTSYYDSEKGNINSIINREYIGEFSHIISASSDTGSKELNLPYYIISLHIACTRANWYKNGQTRNNTSDIFESNHGIELSYEGIDGTTYNKKYIMSVVHEIPNVTNSRHDNGSHIYEASWTDFNFYVEFLPVK